MTPKFWANLGEVNNFIPGEEPMEYNTPRTLMVVNPGSIGVDVEFIHGMTYRKALSRYSIVPYRDLMPTNIGPVHPDETIHEDVTFLVL